MKRDTLSHEIKQNLYDADDFSQNCEKAKDNYAPYKRYIY